LTIPRFLVFNKKNLVKNIDFQETSSTLHTFEVNTLDKIEVQSLFAKLLQEINKNTDEEMAKSKSYNERLFQEKIYHEISAISICSLHSILTKILEKENKEIIEKMKKIESENNKDIFAEFQSQAQKVLEEFRTEGKSLIKETQEFLAQLQSFSKEKNLMLTPRTNSATSLQDVIELQDHSLLLHKSKSVHQINELEKENITPNKQQDSDVNMKKEIRLIWDTINTIIGNTHDHLEKIRHEINRINNRKENYHIKSNKIFLEKEMPHIITKIKDQVHNYIIGVQKEFEDKIITLEDNFLNTSKKNIEIKKTLLEEEEEVEINLVENQNNFEEMIQSFQSPFLRMRKDEFTEKAKPKQSSSVQTDLEVLKEESLPSLWATLDLVAIRLNYLEHKIAC